jgi:hypothetical protein
MRIAIRDVDKVIQTKPLFPPCEQWLRHNEGVQFDAIPENHIHIMDGDVRRTIPIEFVDVIL